MTLCNFVLRLCSPVLLAFVVLLSAAQAQDKPVQDVPAPQTFGAWTKVCSLPPGTPNIQCEVVQNIRAVNRPDIAFHISFLRMPQDASAPQQRAVLMRVFVPIRVELRLGVGIRVDDKDLGRMEYRRCLGDTCVAEVILKDDEFKAFEKGKNATYFIFPTTQEGVGGVVDLNGLTAAFEALPN